MYKVVEITGKIQEYKGYEIKSDTIITALLIAGMLYFLMRVK